jgi:hypothetical protein
MKKESCICFDAAQTNGLMTEFLSGKITSHYYPAPSKLRAAIIESSNTSV